MSKYVTNSPLQSIFNLTNVKKNLPRVDSLSRLVITHFPNFHIRAHGQLVKIKIMKKVIIYGASWQIWNFNFSEIGTKETLAIHKYFWDDVSSSRSACGIRGHTLTTLGWW